MRAKRLRGSPNLQRLGRVRISFQLLRIDESVRRRHVRLLQNRDRIPRNLHPRNSRRQISIQRQVIKCDRNFLGSTTTDQTKMKMQRSLSTMLPS